MKCVQYTILGLFLMSSLAGSLYSMDQETPQGFQSQDGHYRVIPDDVRREYDSEESDDETPNFDEISNPTDIHLNQHLSSFFKLLMLRVINS